MDWYNLLPKELLEETYRAETDPALSQGDAIRVVDLLKENGYVVLGVDVWLSTNPGPTIPTPFVYDWGATRSIPAQYHRKPASAFIRDFQWHPDDKSHGGREPYHCTTQ